MDLYDDSSYQIIDIIYKAVAGKSPLLGRQTGNLGHIGAGNSRPIKRNKRLSESMRPAIRPKLRYGYSLLYSSHKLP